jgi:chitinase
LASCSSPGAVLITVMLCLFPAILRADLWSTGYLPGWEPASNVDCTPLTHVIHFSVVPGTNGTLNASANGITTANSADLVSRTHAAGKQVLICVGGAGSETAFLGATSPATLPAFINNLTNFMATSGYDGVDIDWEPLTLADARQYTNLVNGLRFALNEFPRPKLLTAAVGAYSPYGDPPASEYTLFASLQNQFDQINIMTYDLSGPYAGWVTWYNSPLFDGGCRFPSTGGLLPSVNGAVSNFISNGMSPRKLGIGIPFYGYVWTGTNIVQPRQSWINAPAVAQLGYDAIMTSYYQSNLYHWDTNVQAAYLSITNGDPARDVFISYDDQHACQAKVNYARNHGLGGVMVWELAQDHQGGQFDSLALALKQALRTPGLSSLQRKSDNMKLTFNNSGMGSPLQIGDVGTATNQVNHFNGTQPPP